MWLLTLVWHKDRSLVSGCLSNMFPRPRLAPNIMLSQFFSSHNFNSAPALSNQMPEAED